MKKLILLISMFFFAMAATAESTPYKAFGDDKVFYSAFNSSFIEPSIADTYRITRGKDKGLVNIALITNDEVGGKTAAVSGSVSNIFQQSQTLSFFEVREGDSVYYLAPFDFENEDFLTFKIEVKANPQAPAYSLSFQKTMYHDD
ncbi:MAG: DUF4426 domain-containing protein [bacterium]